MNLVALIGRITKDPCITYTRQGIPTCMFSLAVPRDYKNQKGTYDTDFIQIVSWREAAKLLVMYVKKGDQIGISGKLVTRSYISEKDGIKRYITEVQAKHIKFLEHRASSDNIDQIFEDDSNTTEEEI